jgi:hypothetical protein
MRTVARLAVLSLVAGLAGGVAPAAAEPDTTISVPADWVADTATDAHGHLFIADPSPGTILVRNADGSTLTTITDLAGVGSLALSPDGTTLYAAVTGAAAVAAIDTTTLTETARYATGASTCPSSVAAGDDKIWFAYANCPATGGHIGVVDLAVEPPAVTLDASPASFDWAPLLELAPGDQSRLLAGELGSGSGLLHAFGASGTTLTAGPTLALHLRDFTVSPDGTAVYTASADGNDIRYGRYHAADLTLERDYGAVSASPPGHVAVTAAGVLAVGDVDVFLPDGTRVRNYSALLSGSHGSLVFSADASILYGFTTGSGAAQLHIWHDPTKQVPTIGLSRSVTPRINQLFTITGTMNAVKPVPAGLTIHLKRTSKFGTTVLPNVTTKAGGAFSLVDKVARRGAFTYVATFDGDTERTASARSYSIYVTGLLPALTITTDRAAYAYLGRATVTAHLGRTYGSRYLRLSTLSVVPYGTYARTLRTAPVNSQGALSAVYYPATRTTFTAFFGGDDIYEPRTVGSTITVAPVLSQALSRYYTTSGSYRVYHASVNPLLTATVRPNNEAACQAFEAQQFYGGTWHPNTTNPCLRLHGTGDNKTSTVGAELTTTGGDRTGGVFRIRSIFVGSPMNTRVVGGWLYLKFTA